MSYEYFTTDKRLKLIFHYDELTKSSNIPIHWHKDPELLFITSGVASILSDTVTFTASAGEIAIISGNRLHTIRAQSESCSYYCIIPSIELWKGCVQFPYVSNLTEAIKLFKAIVNELELREKYYEKVVQGYVKSMLALLSRQVKSQPFQADVSNGKIMIVRSAVDYIYENYEKPLTVSDICNEVSVSKYYLCHIFKEITGSTLLSHLRHVRCEKACSLIKSGNHSVSESAFMCGFCNMSYFSKVYKSYFGHLPHLDMPSAASDNDSEVFGL